MHSAVFVSPHLITMDGGVPKPHGSSNSGGYITVNMLDRQAMLFSERGDLLRDSKNFIRRIESEMKIGLHEVERLVLIVNTISMNVVEPLLTYLPPEKIITLVCPCAMRGLNFAGSLPGIIPVERCNDAEKMLVMIRGWLNSGRLPISRTLSAAGRA